MISLEQNVKERRLYASYFNESGKVNRRQINIPHNELFEWIECEPNDPGRSKKFRSFDGNPVKKVRRRALNRLRLIEFMNQYISEHTKKVIHSSNPPEKWFMDIEVEVIDEFPKASDPKEKVLSVAFCNQKNQAFILSIDKLTPIQKEKITDKVNKHIKSLDVEFDIKFKYYETEPMMLSDLFYNFLPAMPFISGWNFIKFDWQFLVNRAKNVGVDPKRCSLSKTMYQTVIKDKYNKQKVDIIDMPHHKAIVDYLTIYNQWDTQIKLKSSGNLDFVANEVLGIPKVPYEGSLMDLYHRSKVDFLFYNVIDAILVSQIDEKLQTFNTMQKLSCEGRVNLNDAGYASVVLASLFSEELYKRGIVLVSKKKHEKERYKGGFVYEPTKGLFENVVIFDFESMFPSIMMFLNTGTDNYIGKTMDEGKTFVDTYNGIHKIDPEKHTWSASGAVFEKHKGDSVMRAVVGRLFDDRITAKKASGVIDREISELEKILEKTKK